jgi:hypothetical protein
MVTFSTANRVRLSIKMKLSQHSWYKSSLVISDSDGYSIVINVKQLNNQIRKLISPVVEGVSIKTEVE